MCSLTGLGYGTVEKTVFHRRKYGTLINLSARGVAQHVGQHAPCPHIDGLTQGRRTFDGKLGLDGTLYHCFGRRQGDVHHTAHTGQSQCVGGMGTDGNTQKGHQKG